MSGAGDCAMELVNLPGRIRSIYVTYRLSAAAPEVRSFIDRYSEREGGTLGRDGLLLPARTDQFIEIYIQDSYLVAQGSGPARAAPDMVVVGPQDRAANRLFYPANILTFTIRFQPTGLNRLWGHSVSELTNEAAATEAYFAGGLASRLAQLRGQISSAVDFSARVALADAFFRREACDARPADVIDGIACALVTGEGFRSIAQLSRTAVLSDRRFRDVFHRRTGLSPKRYIQAIRLGEAFDHFNRFPRSSLTEIAHAAGFYDQSHFIREVRNLAGGAPSRVFGQDILSLRT